MNEGPTTGPDYTAALSQATEEIWEAEWRRIDLSADAMRRLSKEEIRQHMADLPGGYESVFERARLAEAFPPDRRYREYSPQTHSAWFKKGLTEDGIREWINKRRRTGRGNRASSDSAPAGAAPNGKVAPDAATGMVKELSSLFQDFSARLAILAERGGGAASP